MTETRTVHSARGHGDDGAGAEPTDPDLGSQAEMLRDVLDGLSRPQKELSSKYFYDAHGSELFERITELDEYYPTRTERALLTRWMPEWVASLRPAALVELGAGSAAKTRIILDAMQASGSGRLYVPVDISGDFLVETAAQLRTEYDDLRVEPAVMDIAASFRLPVDPPEPTWYALLGSTIGNFAPVQASRLLARVARQMRPGDRFLMGADLRPGSSKSPQRLERAYNDAKGVTAAFNLHVLEVLNREVESDFDPSCFRHRALYVASAARIEMHLVSTCAQTVSFPNDHLIRLEAGETIRTEISCKYDRPSIDEIFSDAGLSVSLWEEDPQGYFALTLAGHSG